MRRAAMLVVRASVRGGSASTCRESAQSIAPGTTRRGGGARECPSCGGETGRKERAPFRDRPPAPARVPEVGRRGPAVVAPADLTVSTASLEGGTGHARLADNRQQGADAPLPMVRHRHSDRAVGAGLLHRGMAAALSRPDEAVRLENPADLPAGQDAQPRRLRRRML